MVHWVVLGLISALFLGLYDGVKKNSVQHNAALPTLWVCTSVGSLLCASLLGWGWVQAQTSGHSPLYFELSFQDHIAISIKAFIVSSSWLFAYISLKVLPLSVASPIRASGPLWTLLGASVLFAEVPSMLQATGFAIAMGSYLWFSWAGKKDGCFNLPWRWVSCAITGALIGSCSGLYDKFLIQNMNFNPIALQLWFSVHMCWIQGIVFVIIWKFKPERTPFTWRWSMPWVSFFLLLADAAYFHALVDPDAKIGLLSGVRRGSLLITFTIGWLWFKEANIAKRWAPVCGLVLGLALISWASH